MPWRIKKSVKIILELWNYSNMYWLMICFRMCYVNLPFAFQSWNIKLTFLWGSWCTFFLFKCPYVSVHWQVFLFHNVSTSFFQKNVPSSPLSRDRDLFIYSNSLLSGLNYSLKLFPWITEVQIFAKTIPADSAQRAEVFRLFALSYSFHWANTKLGGEGLLDAQVLGFSSL